jgi:hypothetical protein
MNAMLCRLFGTSNMFSFVQIFLSSKNNQPRDRDDRRFARAGALDQWPPPEGAAATSITWTTATVHAADLRAKS